MALPSYVTKYLEKYSGNLYPIHSKDKLLDIDNIIVIPLLAEFGNLNLLIKSLSKNKKKYLKSTLILFVVNNVTNANDEIKKNNLKSIDYLEKYENEYLRIAYINASTKGYELDGKEGGVGLARKCGMDAALRLFNYSSLNKKILICLDGDCTVSENYIEVIANSYNKLNLDAAVINYEHDIEGENEFTKAILCYESFLRYYTLSLKSAGSPYSFHTIGSAMSCTVEAYIKTEGMNKRKAAEDFYFLNKLAKNYSIAFLKEAYVYPSGRGSFRVPFGTGQRVNRFLSNKQNEYLLYNPVSFERLKNWYKIYLDPEFDLNSLNKVDNETLLFLDSLNFKSGFLKIQENCKSKTQLYTQKLRWFDGFKNLKYIHFLRDNFFEDVDMFEAMDYLLKKYDIKIKKDSDLIITHKKYLNAIKNIYNQCL